MSGFVAVAVKDADTVEIDMGSIGRHLGETTHEYHYRLLAKAWKMADFVYFGEQEVIALFDNDTGKTMYIANGRDIEELRVNIENYRMLATAACRGAHPEPETIQ